jgi:hypothetical protein
MHSILNVFDCTYSIFVVYFNVSIICFNAFIICFNVFQYISMGLNVFINIVIGISSSHSHCKVFAMHIHLCIFFFTLYNDSLFNMLYHYIPFFLFPLIRSNFHTIYMSLFFTTIHHFTFHIPHSMSSLVARSIVEPKYLYVVLKGI